MLVTRCFANHEIEGVWVSEPFWALPNWLNLDIPEFAGPFASHKEASSQIRIIRNNNDPRLDKIK